MSVTVQALSELNPDDVAARAELLAEMLQEHNPTLDAKRGVLREVLVQPAAQFNQAAATEIERYNRARSLLEITADPTLAADDLVDSVFSLYRVERRIGSAARGPITIVLSQAINVTIRTGAVFEANGRQYVTETIFTSQPSSASAAAASDRVLTQLAADRWGFEIEVVAVEAGAAGRLTKNTTLVPLEQPSSFVKAYAAADFTGGSDTETNAQMVARLSRGVAAKGGSNRLNMDAMLLEQPAFANILTSSVIGFGDPEQLRNHTIWPGQMGSRLDWYVRTSDRPLLVELAVTATLLEHDFDDRGIWQFSLGKDDAPGFYDVVKILPVDSDQTLGSYPIVTETRSFDLTDEEHAPDVESAVEATFSPLQTAIVKFKDEDKQISAITVGSTAEYSVTVRMMPLLRELQDFANGRRVQHTGADTIIKAPVPCFVQVSFSIALRSNDTQPDLAAIKNALATFVNRSGFTGRLPASALSAVIQAHLEAPAAASALDLFGLILRPDLSIKPLRSTEVLLVPDEPERMTTPRTTVFILEPTDVAISLDYVDMPEI